MSNKAVSETMLHRLGPAQGRTYATTAMKLLSDEPGGYFMTDVTNSATAAANSSGS